MRFSPPIRGRVLQLIDDVDDGRCAIAAVWREVGHRAREQEQLQPSYESVRRLVHELRSARRPGPSRLRRAAARVAWCLPRIRAPHELTIVVVVDGDLRRPADEHRRRPRDDSSRATSRGSA